MYRKGNRIIIQSMTHPGNVSDFMKAIFYKRKEKHSSLDLDFEDVDLTYPNVCAPFAGVIDYYRSHGLTFQVQGELPDYLQRISLMTPLAVSQNEPQLSLACLDRVWVFRESVEVNKLVDAFVKEISKAIVCQKGILETLEWCTNEIMDNVLQHSGTSVGFAMGQVHKQTNHIAFCVFDYGEGIFNSLKGSKHTPRSDVDAISLAIQEGVTRDPSLGQGNGLWGLHRIVENNSGRLAITSGGASWVLTDNDVKTYKKIPFLSPENRTATVDFQLDTEKEISIAKALGGHKPVSFYLEGFEDEKGKINYPLSKQASGTGTRQSGERIRNEIMNLLDAHGKPIVIDFTGISVVSSSFADELCGKLLEHFGFFGFNKAIRLANMNETVQMIVHRSISQRLAEGLNQGTG